MIILMRNLMIILTMMIMMSNSGLMKFIYCYAILSNLFISLLSVRASLGSPCYRWTN